LQHSKLTSYVEILRTFQTDFAVDNQLAIANDIPRRDVLMIRIENTDKMSEAMKKLSGTGRHNQLWAQAAVIDNKREGRSSQHFPGIQFWRG